MSSDPPPVLFQKCSNCGADYPVDDRCCPRCGRFAKKPMTLPQMVISGCLLAAALPFGLVGTCSLAMAVNEWDTVSFLMGAVILAIGIGLMALGLINARN